MGIWRTWKIKGEIPKVRKEDQGKRLQLILN